MKEDKKQIENEINLCPEPWVTLLFRDGEKEDLRKIR